MVREFNLGAINSVSPAIPFTALYTPTPTPRERRSIHLDFTPLVTPTPRKSAGRRSFIPQQLQAYNKQFLLGLGLFLGLSALYKGLSLFREALRAGPEPLSVVEIASVEPAPLISTEAVDTVTNVENVPDPMTMRLYEESLVQVAELMEQVTTLQIALKTSLAESKTSCDTEVAACTNMLNLTSSSLSRCEARISQVELDSSRFVQKLESDFQQNLEAIITTKNKQIADFETLVSRLEAEVKSLKILPKPTPILESPKSPKTPIESVEKELITSSIVLALLTCISTITIIVALYLYQDRRRIVEMNRQLDTSHLTAISSPPPVLLEAEIVSSENFESQEHLAMTIEDTRASILRGVTAHVCEIEEQHESEMIRLRALLMETGDASREISLAIKGIISDTSMVSTAAHNTPGLSDILSSSSDEEDESIQFSSLSQRLESAATTPLRIETKNWLSKANLQSQQPTACPPSSVIQPAGIESFVIGSPKVPRDFMEYSLGDSSDESSSEMALEQIRGNFGYTH